MASIVANARIILLPTVFLSKDYHSDVRNIRNDRYYSLIIKTFHRISINSIVISTYTVKGAKKLLSFAS